MIKADGRCHSWRPGTRPHAPRHEPGPCHRCWRPCWAKVPRDGCTVRCDECVEAILRLNTARLARMLLEEPYVPERLSERLVSDLDAGVALAASERLAGAAGQLAGAVATSASSHAGEESDSPWAGARDEDATAEPPSQDASAAFDETVEIVQVDVPPVPSWDDVSTPEDPVLTDSDGRPNESSEATSEEWGEW